MNKTPDISPLPWTVHYTGSTIGLKDANGKFVIRKTVNMVSHEDYFQLKVNLEYIASRTKPSLVAIVEGLGKHVFKAAPNHELGGDRLCVRCGGELTDLDRHYTYEEARARRSNIY